MFHPKYRVTQKGFLALKREKFYSKWFYLILQISDMSDCERFTSLNKMNFPPSEKCCVKKACFNERRLHFVE